jgi:hypothetical protein
MVRAQGCNDANASCLFTRIVQRKNLPWEDSIAKAAYDPAHIPDCNDKATVGQHFLFHDRRGKYASLCVLALFREPVSSVNNGREF